MMSWSREEVIILLEEYQKFPNLYKIKSANYKNRNLRKEALKSIVNALKSKKPEITEVEVQQKFQALKQNALKERKKHESSIKSGAGTDEIYEPSLWYFNHISFVFDHVVPRESYDSLSLDVQDETSVENCLLSPNSNEENMTIPCIATIADSGELVPENNSAQEFSWQMSPTAGTSKRAVDSTGPMSPIAGPSKRFHEESSGQASPISVGPGPSKKLRKAADKNFLEAVTGNLKQLTNLTNKLEGSTEAPRKSANAIFGEYVAAKLDKVDVEEIRDELEGKIILEINAALKKCRELKK